MLNVAILRSFSVFTIVLYFLVGSNAFSLVTIVLHLHLIYRMAAHIRACSSDVSRSNALTYFSREECTYAQSITSHKLGHNTCEQTVDKVTQVPLEIIYVTSRSLCSTRSNISVHQTQSVRRARKIQA